MIRLVAAGSIVGVVLVMAFLLPQRDGDPRPQPRALLPTATVTQVSRDYIVTHDPCMRAAADGSALQRAASFDLDKGHRWRLCAGGISTGHVEKVLFYSDGNVTHWRMIARTAWEQPLPPGAGELPSAGSTDEFFFTSALVGWLATFGPGQNLWRSHDGGFTWEPLTTLARPAVPVVALELDDPVRGRVAFGDGNEWFTYDRGNTWVAADWSALIHTDEPCRIFRLQDGNGFKLDESHEWWLCYGSAGGGSVSKILLFSGDGGSSWALTSWGIVFPYFITRPPTVGTMSGPGIVTDLVFTTPSDGWMATGGHTSHFHRTQDGGANWHRVELDPMPTLGVTEVAFSSPRSGRVTFAGGEVWITQDGGDTWFELAPTPTPIP